MKPLSPLGILYEIKVPFTSRSFFERPRSSCKYSGNGNEVHHSLASLEHPPRLGRKYAKTPGGPQKIQDLSEDCLSHTVRVLRADFGKEQPCNAARTTVADQMLNRLHTLPVSAKIRKLLYRSRIVPKVSWGFWWQRTPDSLRKKWTSRLRLVFCVQRSASRDLWQLLCGHWTDMNIVFEATWS